MCCKLYTLVHYSPALHHITNLLIYSTSVVDSISQALSICKDQWIKSYIKWKINWFAWTDRDKHVCTRAHTVTTGKPYKWHFPCQNIVLVHWSQLTFWATPSLLLYIIIVVTRGCSYYHILTARHLVTVIIKLVEHFITGVIHLYDKLAKVFNFISPVIVA